MSIDVVALTVQAPDARALAMSMAEADPDLRVQEAGSGAIVQLCDDDGMPLVAIEAAQRVEVAAEVERLLGEGVAEGLVTPFWWVEARATGDIDRSAEVAHRFAAALVRQLGGRVWPPHSKHAKEGV
ncbi:hypothetical protein ACQP1W_02270 [Spirillospora sp. CA-255316]